MCRSGAVGGLGVEVVRGAPEVDVRHEERGRRDRPAERPRLVGEEGDPARRQHRRDDREVGRQDAQRPALVEVEQAEPALADLLDDERGDQEARDHEEHVDAGEAARHQRHAGVEAARPGRSRPPAARRCADGTASLASLRRHPRRPPGVAADQGTRVTPDGSRQGGRQGRCNIRGPEGPVSRRTWRSPPAEDRRGRRAGSSWRRRKWGARPGQGGRRMPRGRIRRVRIGPRVPGGRAGGVSGPV